MSSMDPSGGAPWDVYQSSSASDGAGGGCSVCGRPIPAPDLEAVAADIDQALSLETGRVVARTAWAGRPPDGLVDALFSFTSGAKARRQIWERGQQLWAERMSAAMSGMCAGCQAAAAGQPPAATMMQTGGAPAYSPVDQMPLGGTPYDAGAPAMPPEPVPPAGSPYDSGTAVMPSEPAPTAYQMPAAEPYAFGSSAPTGQDEEQATAAFQPYTASPLGSPQADDEAATRAVPSFLQNPPERAPSAPTPEPAAPPVSDYESHTVMFTAPQSLRPAAAPARLTVLEGPVHGRHFTLSRATTTIGRSIGCHVTVDDDAVAYEHVRVVRGNEGWLLEGVAGGGAVYVNDAPVSGAHALRGGDVIRVGAARIRFESTN